MIRYFLLLGADADGREPRAVCVPVPDFWAFSCSRSAYVSRSSVTASLTCKHSRHTHSRFLFNRPLLVDLGWWHTVKKLVQESCISRLAQETCTSVAVSCASFFLHQIKRSSIACEKLACTWPKLRALIGRLYNAALMVTMSLLLLCGVCY